MTQVIRPHFGDCKIDERQRTHNECKHSTILVDEHSVECRACHKVLSAIAVLNDFARRERSLRHWEQERVRLLREIDELKAERTKLKRSIKCTAPKETSTDGK